MIALKMSCPWVSNRDKMTSEKTMKYAPLRWELKQRYPVQYHRYREDIESLEKLLELLDLFKDCNCLKLNQSISVAMWLGKNANKTDTLFGVQWPQRPISALGISFSFNLKLCEQENFSQKITP